MKKQTIVNQLDILTDYFNKNIAQYIGKSGYVIYGSFVEQFHNLPTNVQDIDVTIIRDDSDKIETETETIHIDDIPYDINIEYLNYTEFSLQSSEPKFLMCFTDMSTDFELSILKRTHKNEGKYRSTISSVCNKAFNKGKKKLTVQDDYDVSLGLKNIYHSIKFAIVAMWYAKNITRFHDRDFDLLFLTTFYNDIHRIYNNSTGTLEERANEVLKYAKPIYNSTMTEFRKHFPKVLD